MPIQFTCSCGRALQAKEEHAGRRVQCPACGAQATVPPGDEAVVPAEVAQPKPSPVQAGESRRPKDEDDYDEDRPRRRSRQREDDEEDEDDRPRRRSRERDAEDEDRPRRRSREDDEDDEDDRPRRREPAETSGKATAALVLGLLAFCLGILTGIPAIILALMSFGDISRSRGRLGGKGLAVAGLILGCLGTLVSAVGGYFAFMGMSEARDRDTVTDDMHQMGLAMHNYHSTYGHFPQVTPNPQAPPAMPFQPAKRLSWRVDLLPYLEHDNLWRQFRQDEPWDSPHNKALLTPMPKVFQHPKHPEANAQGLTYFRVFTGWHTMFPPGRGLGMMEITDGTSNTIMVVEAAEPVPWTKPDELVYDPQNPLPKLGGHFRGGTLVLLADGEVRTIGPEVSERTLRAAITPADGDILGPDW
jgi:hypothetical protein